MTAGPDDCVHLTVDEVREIHAEAIYRFGGLDGGRDLPLLESAVAAPKAGCGGASLYADLLEVAAAYLFYICRNHPFLDGNKRTGLGACLVFLALNGVETPDDGPDWESLTSGVASGTLDRDATTTELRRIIGGPGPR
ncbi:MAG: type II toxin-antitoxin system death-on-curing family toxin [Acidobacteria bacterium]|nr:type II toxin-antitoxin system death-on-curing family toxin [Acidobacteriota bacterium]